MSGDVPDVRSARGADDEAIAANPDNEDSVPLIQVKLVEDVFTAPQKREIVERLADAMARDRGEETRSVKWRLVEDVAT